MNKLNYCVAGHYFCIVADNTEYIKMMLPSYHDFTCNEPYGKEPLFLLYITEEKLRRYEKRMDTFTIDGGQGLACAGENGFSFEIYANLTKKITCLNTDCSFKEAKVSLSGLDIYSASFGLNNAIMIMYAFASSFHKTLLVHSSVVVHQNLGYLFLGKSGTGKSTHSRLWIENIKDTFLLNDDNPIIRNLNGKILVYGSPWSGKTQCYRNDSFKVGGIIRLKQMPYNKISMLGKAQSYASLISSCSIIRQAPVINRNIEYTVSEIVNIVPSYFLECLPNADAAKTAYNSFVASSHPDSQII